MVQVPQLKIVILNTLDNHAQLITNVLYHLIVAQNQDVLQEVYAIMDKNKQKTTVIIILNVRLDVAQNINAAILSNASTTVRLILIVKQLSAVHLSIVQHLLLAQVGKPMEIIATPRKNARVKYAKITSVHNKNH